MIDLIDGTDVGYAGRYFSRYLCGFPLVASCLDLTWEYQ